MTENPFAPEPRSKYFTPAELSMSLSGTLFYAILTPIAINTMLDMCNPLNPSSCREGHISEKNTPAGLYLLPGIALFAGLLYAYANKHYTAQTNTCPPIRKEHKPDPNPERELEARLQYVSMYLALLAGYTVDGLGISNFFTRFWQHGGFPLVAAASFTAGDVLYATHADLISELPSVSTIFMPALLVMFGLISANNIPPSSTRAYESGSAFDFVAPMMTLATCYTFFHMLKLHGKGIMIPYLASWQETKTSIPGMEKILLIMQATLPALKETVSNATLDLSEKTNELAKLPSIGAFTALCVGQILMTRADNPTAATVWKDGGYIVGTLAGAALGRLAHHAKKAIENCRSQESDLLDGDAYRLMPGSFSDEETGTPTGMLKKTTSFQ